MLYFIISKAINYMPPRNKKTMAIKIGYRPITSLPSWEPSLGGTQVPGQFATPTSRAASAVRAWTQEPDHPDKSRVNLLYRGGTLCIQTRNL